MIRSRISALLSIAGAVAAGAVLFWTSQSVQQAESNLARLKKGVQSEEQAIRVLHAEWDYLNRPERLESLATQYLGLSSASAFSVSDDMSALPDPFMPALPGHKPALEARPIAIQSVLSPAPVPAPERKTVVPHVRPQNEQSFQGLLKELNQEGGGR